MVYPEPFGRADLQVHTAHGDGMADALAVFERIEEASFLDVVAVTDHDDIGGALVARQTYERTRERWHFDLVTGIEVTTLHGHLLALWVERPVRPFRPLEETVAAIHEAGGIAVVPHPFSLLTRSVGRRTLDRVMLIADEATHPDGIEVANTLSKGWHAGAHAATRNRERWQIAETGGSDAHFLETLGRAYTRYPGSGQAALRSAIEARRTTGVLLGATPYRDIGVRQLVAQQVRGLSVTPRKVLGPPLAGAVRGLRWRRHSEPPR